VRPSPTTKRFVGTAAATAAFAAGLLAAALRIDSVPEPWGRRPATVARLGLYPGDRQRIADLSRDPRRDDSLALLRNSKVFLGCYDVQMPPEISLRSLWHVKLVADPLQRPLHPGPAVIDPPGDNPSTWHTRKSAVIFGQGNVFSGVGFLLFVEPVPRMYASYSTDIGLLDIGWRRVFFQRVSCPP